MRNVLCGEAGQSEQELEWRPRRARLASAALACLCLLEVGSGHSWADPPAPGGRLISEWLFEETSWASLRGDLPLGFTNLALIAEGDGNSMELSQTNMAFLNYAVVEADGSTNLALASGGAGIIAGVEDPNGVIHLTEGQHRMNAALDV